MNIINYDIFRNSQKLRGGSLILEEFKKYLRSNLFIAKVGKIKSFNVETQEGIVLLKEYEGLEIKTRTLSTFKLDLKENDEVILLQSSINIFNENDNNYFDKNYFYILNAVNLTKASIELEEFSINIKNPIEIKTEVESLKNCFQELVETLNSLKVTGQATVSPDFYVNVAKIMPKVSNVLK